MAKIISEEATHTATLTDIADVYLQMGVEFSIARGAKPNYIEAHKWFNIACMQGSVEARKYRQEISMEMNKDEIALALKYARDWVKKHLLH